MNLLTAIFIALAALIGLFIGRKNSKLDAQTSKLNEQIESDKRLANAKEFYANQKVKEYEEALKKYNSNDGDDNAS